MTGFQQDDPLDDGIYDELRDTAHDSINEIEIAKSNMEIGQGCRTLS